MLFIYKMRLAATFKRIGGNGLISVWVFFCFCSLTVAQPQHVEVKLNDQGEFRLFKNGTEFYIKGAGGTEHWEEVVKAGGNSVRTWSTDNAREMLDKAQSLGLMVMMGLWVQHERHGFDYDNEAKVKLQLEQFRKVVLEIKDHPALLLWGVGNEVDLFYSNTKVWKAVDDIAKMIHELDPHHPTTTVTAGLDPEEVKLIKRDAPNIDIYSVNTYGEIAAVRANIRNYGWEGPYLITEWGPNGHWEVQKTKWGTPIEQTSSEKAISYRDRYTNEILADSKYCMGSYVFLWGQKQETTSTWYGLFSEDGKQSEAIDVLKEVWSNVPTNNHSPKLTLLQLEGKKCHDSVELYADNRALGEVKFQDIDGDDCQVKWSVVPESNDIKSGGDAESKPLPVSGVIKRRSKNQVEFRVPNVPGAYRLFVEVYDNAGHYAYANFPFLVKERTADMPAARWLKVKTYSDDSWKVD